ncbi:MAG TPA: hypothetical protein DGG95_02620 [Cytophagales bacterium]|nr:hypothetical protein [Cytophagales bacterium]
MKTFFGLWLSALFMLGSTAIYAQSYAEEALIFSRLSSTGSARIQAMGGAQVALGGDYSSAFSNPAGLGFFNRSEATLSLGTNFYNSTSSYYGTNTKDSQGNFNIPGFSVVFHSDKENGKLVSGNFAISLTRTNNFNQNFTYQGINPNNSLLDYFVQQSYGTYPGSFRDDTDPSYYSLQRLAYHTFLIGPQNEVSPHADSSVWDTYANQIPFQRERVKVNGAQNQVNFAYGLNFNDKIYFGGAIGLASFNYHSKNSYSESFDNAATNNNPYPLLGFNLLEDYSIKGSGINATIGTIVKPLDFLQFGLSVATPTYYYDINDSYSASVTAGWNTYRYVDTTYQSNTTQFVRGNNNVITDTISQIIANYSLSTPWRIKAGATVFIAKHGLITAEVEKVNYTKARLKSNTDGLDFSFDNSDIKSLYRNVFNLRLGGEYRFKNFRIRTGYSYMPDPYIAQNKVDNSISGYTGGVGYRTSKYFVDLGFSLTQWNSMYRPYTLYSGNSISIDSPYVKLQHSNTSVMITFGYNL